MSSVILSVFSVCARVLRRPRDLRLHAGDLARALCRLAHARRDGFDRAVKPIHPRSEFLVELLLAGLAQRDVLDGARDQDGRAVGLPDRLAHSVEPKVLARLRLQAIFQVKRRPAAAVHDVILESLQRARLVLGVQTVGPRVQLVRKI